MASTSITYWTRLEPRPRSPSIARALRAEARDPAWFLARQWQFGEFRGADSGSPSYVEVRTRTAPIDSWRAPSEASQPLEAGVPLEASMLSEIVDGADMSLAVELAQTFEAMLGEAGVDTSVVGLYAPVYPLPDPASAPDRETARFLTAVAGRAWDGLAFFAAADAAGTSPSEPSIPSAWQAAVDDVVGAFVSWVRGTYGTIAIGAAPPEPSTWERERLRYTGEVVAPTEASSSSVFALNPGPRGELDWYALDDERTEAATNSPAAAETRFVLPGNVRFRGMPNARFWDFEPAGTDFGAIEVDKRDLARMIATEFALTQSNDWFTIPMSLAPGSLVEVDWLLVHDVFGQVTQIRRANADPVVSVVGAWNMFAPTRRDGTASPRFAFPDVAMQLTESRPIEEALFVRDEVANMAWAIEKTVPNGLGEGRRRRDLESEIADTRGPPASTDTESPLRYIVQSEVPREWIPLLPKAVGGGQMALVRGAMLDTSTGGLSPIDSRGQVIGGAALTLREEEVPRSGTRVRRGWICVRDRDGGSRLFVMRRRTTAGSEGSSKLRFDLAKERGA